MSTLVVRALLVLGGVAAGVYGAILLLRLDLERLVSTVIWLAGGVIVHDGLLAPAVVVLGVVAARLLPRAARLPATVALVVWGTVTVASLPVLTGVGGKPDNPTLLDKPYLAAWLVGTLLVLVLTVAATAVRTRRRSAPREAQRRN